MSAFPLPFSRPGRPRFPTDMVALPLVAILLMAALLWLGGNGLARLVGQTEQIVGFNLDASVHVARLATRVQAVGALLYHTMTQRAAGSDRAEIQANLDRLAAEVDGVQADLGAYRDTYATAEQRQAIDEVQGELANYKRALDWVRAMLEIDFNSAVSFIRPFNAMFERLNGMITGMTAELQQDARSRAATAARDARATGRWFLLLTAITAVAAVLTSWVTGRHQLQLYVNAQALEKEVAARTAELQHTTDDLRAAKDQAEKALADMRAAQRQLIEAEKMAALGSLVAGIAHEINTPVGSALTAASVLEEKTRDFRRHCDAGGVKKADLQRYLETAGEACILTLSNLRRAAELIHSFKQVAVDQASASRRTFALRTCLEELLLSLRPRLRVTHITVALDCPAGLNVNGYPGALSQVVTNLVMNSLAHAYDDGQSGTITITGREAEPGMVEFQYRDDGRGIPAAILPKVFDPFFTTKRGAGGTGLGLHIVYNNVTQKLGGTISVSSTEGQGTLFVITFPETAPAELEHAPG